MSVSVTKADGEVEAYDPKKLLNSLRRAGAEDEAAATIAQEVEGHLYAGITTQEIYRHAFARLRAHRRGLAARYSLKRAVLELGPSGFPFEAYMAELFRTEGYTAVIDQIVQGACVEHEVDAILRKKDEVVYVEAKFHNAAGFKTDLKTILYVKSRLDDIAAQRKQSKAPGIMKGLIITNTKFTSHATRYASCAGVDLLGWEYPLSSGLNGRIEKAKLYPITALTTLNRREKMALLSQKVVLCSQLAKDTSALAAAGILGKKADEVLEEAGTLCAGTGKVQ